MAWVRDTGWGGVHQSNTWSALTTQPSFYTLIPESCPFLNQREPSRKKSQTMVGEKATIIYAHEKWSTAMRRSPMLESPPRETTKNVPVTCQSLGMLLPQTSLMVTYSTPTKPRAKIKTAFPSLEEGQRPTQTCSVCLYQVTYLEKWISVHLSLIKKAHYEVFGFYPYL